MDTEHSCGLNSTELLLRHRQNNHTGVIMGIRAVLCTAHCSDVPFPFGTRSPTSPELQSSAGQTAARGCEAHLPFLHIIPVLFCFQPLGWWLFSSSCITSTPSRSLLCSLTSRYSYSWKTKS